MGSRYCCLTPSYTPNRRHVWLKSRDTIYTQGRLICKVAWVASSPRYVNLLCLVRLIRNTSSQFSCTPALNFPGFPIFTTTNFTLFLLCPRIFEKFDRIQWDIQEPGRIWFMKKTWSRKSRVRLSAFCIKLEFSGSKARGFEKEFGRKKATSVQ